MGNAPILSEPVTQPPASRWSGLARKLKRLAPSPDLGTELRQLLQLLQGVAGDCAAGVFLFDEGARTIRGAASEHFDASLNSGKGGLTEAIRSQAPYVFSDLPAKPRAAHAADRSSPPARSQLVVPFQSTGQGRGAIVLRSPEAGAFSAAAFSAADGEALAQFAEAASARIENAALRQKMLCVGEAEAERDLVMAQEIMARLTTRRPPAIPRFDVASAYVPAKVVGGDLVDFIALPDDHFGFLMADVSGNGIPAALLMTGFRALFRGLIKNDFNIRSVFRKLNNQLLDSTAPQQFVSAFYAGLDTSTHRLIYVNGGHPAPLLYRPRHPVRMLDVGGPVLGILPTASYHEDSVVLHPQDILVCFSDGLSEAENDAGNVFDAHRILRVVEAHRRDPAEAICGALQDEASKFAGNTLRDDVSIMVLKFP